MIIPCTKCGKKAGEAKFWDFEGEFLCTKCGKSEEFTESEWSSEEFTERPEWSWLND